MRTVSYLSWSTALLALITGTACESDVICEDAGCGGLGGGAGGLGGQGAGGQDVPGTATELDILFVVDNSIGMAPHQAFLAAGVRSLLDAVTNPPCVSAGGAVASQPATPSDPCPSGTSRRHAPLQSVHVGVITSSLGALTAPQCDGLGTATPDANDHGRLVTRGAAGPVPTYEDAGFLSYDPVAKQSPPGEPDLETISQRTSDLIVGAGATGCGYEMGLEAMARFLADPAPYESLSQVSSYVQKSGTDAVILQQRAAFLRDTSAVAIVLLSNENDCSMQVEGQGFLLLGPAPFYKSTAVCQNDPSHACCTSCALPPQPGCPPDPTCGGQGSASAAQYTAGEDHPNLRCLEQKRRYGVDFLYPVARYVNALTSPSIDPAALDLAGASSPNPLFEAGRPSTNVHLLTLVGAPWQDLASDPASPASSLLPNAELESGGRWAWLTGGDPFMTESVAVRSGQHPATGASVGAPNAINGGDRTIPGDDLQYACTTPLSTPVPGGCTSCVPTCDDPTCSDADQIAARAYPGQRHLEVARGLGARGVPASICPPDPAAPYRTAFEALAAQLAGSLAK